MNSVQILDYFKNRQEIIVDEIRELVDIESPTGDVEQNSKVVAWLEGKLGEISPPVIVEKVSAEKLGEHLIIRVFPSEQKPIFLLGHTDTVHPIGTQTKNPTRIDGDKFYGCGIFDMKSNIILMLEALRYFAASNTAAARPITILLSCDEEVGSPTGRELVEAEAAAANMCFVFEPSGDGRVKTGRKGTGMYTIKAHGVAAHAGLEPEKGASAILELARQIEKIHAFNKPDIGTTVNVCVINGGTATNVIAEHAECSVDVRFAQMDEAGRIDREIRSLLPFDERVSLEIVGGINRPPLERTADVVALLERAQAAAASFGYEIGEVQVGGASDGNFVGALGIPILDGLGIAGDGAHTLYEHINVSDIANRATLVTMMLQNG